MNSGKKDFKVGDVWLNGGGLRVTILKTDLAGSYPIVGVRQDKDGSQSVLTYMADGQHIKLHPSQIYDLVKKYEPPVGPEEVVVTIEKKSGRIGSVWETTTSLQVAAGWKVVKYRRVDEE